MPPGTIPLVHVKCHSGYTYAQRPVEIRAGGQVYQVVEITAEGRTPEGKWFQVVTGCGRSFRLAYILAEDSWSLIGLETEYNKK